MRFILIIFRLRQRSIARAMLLSLGAFAGSLRLAGFPAVGSLHASSWQILMLFIAIWGMAETTRCLRRQWSIYHAGVLILLYSDLMIVVGILALLILS